MPEEIRRELCALLAPGGEPLGEPTRPRGKVRRIRGGVEDARALFAKLEELGQEDPIPEFRAGKRIKVTGFGHATYREISKSGPPTIDIRFTIKGLENIKLKFVGKRHESAV